MSQLPDSGKTKLKHAAFTTRTCAAELPKLRAIAAAELHNLVFQRDYRIVPATVRTAG